jgi:hypothetical protein
MHEARRCLDAGDRAGALTALEAALTLDREFLAAQLLREKILAPGADAVRAARTAPGAPNDPPFFSADGPGTSLDSRARQKRIAHQAEAAHKAIDHGRWAEAQTALAEIQNLTQAVRVSPFVASAQSGTFHPHKAAAGAWAAGAAMFGVLVLGVWTPDAPLPQTQPTTEKDRGVPTGTVRDVAPEGEPTPPSAPVDPVRDLPPRSEPAPSGGDDAILAARESFEDPSAGVPTSSPVLHAEADDDDQRIRDVLHTYRLAYGRLDARLAREVWPGVNPAALALAFDGLLSQSLVFDACRVQVSGALATATCQGTASYVPKIGTPHARIEPRHWDFTLRKRGLVWEIETAEAEP